jgi:hypothetical protein
MKKRLLWQIPQGIVLRLLLVAAGGLFILNRVLFHPLRTGRVAENVFAVKTEASSEQVQKNGAASPKSKISAVLHHFTTGFWNLETRPSSSINIGAESTPAAKADYAAAT